MDAARSAWRSGASPVTIVYRRGRAEMPAQVEEIEAAEREGIVVRTGLAPVEVVSRDGASSACAASTTRPAAAPIRRRRRRRGSRSPAPRPSSRPARSSSPSARSPTHRSCPRAPASRSAAGPGSSPIPDAGDRPCRGLRRRRRRVRAQDDHRRGRLGPPRSRVDPRVPRGRARRRAGDPRDRPLRDRPGAAALARPGVRPRAHAPLPMVQPGSFAADPGRLRRGDRARRSRPLLPLRRRLRQPRRGRPRRPRPGRPAPRPCHRHRSAGHRTTAQEARDDTRPGLRPLRRRRGLRRRDDRRGARRAVAPRAVAPPGPRLHGPHDRQVHPPARAPTCGGSSTSACATSSLVQVFIGSFIFFYPDVVAGQQLPITGGLAAVCAFAVLLIKLVRHGDETHGVPLGGPAARSRSDALHRPVPPGRPDDRAPRPARRAARSAARDLLNPDLALPLCYLSSALIGVMGLFAVYYNLRSVGQRPAATTAEATR